MTIKFLDIQAQIELLEPALSASIQAVLKHGQFVGGPEVKALQTALADYTGVSHAVACANGTDAIELALRALKIGAGDCVFVPSLTFAATAEAVALTGAMPVFVDVDLVSGNVDATSLREAIADIQAKGALAPRAVIAVDLFSAPADYAAISKICTDHELSFVIDAAQSFGTTTPAGKAGSFGDCATTSFYPSKSLGGFGDSGAVMTNNAELANAIHGIANHGVTAPGSGHHLLGRNSRLDTMQAAILLQKLTILDDELTKRRAIAAKYAEQLADVCTVPTVPDGVQSAWAYYAIQTQDRAGLRAHMQAAGVPSVVYYDQPTHVHDAFVDCPRAPGGLPNTDQLSDTMLCLPVHPYLTESETDQVIAAIRSFG